MTRLSQLGWTPTSSLILSLTLRTSYHVYYGVGFILTIPLGYFVTRSFQKHGRLNRAIAAHFIFDAVSFTLGVLYVAPLFAAAPEGASTSASGLSPTRIV